MRSQAKMRLVAIAVSVLALIAPPAAAAPRQGPDEPETMHEEIQETIEIYMLARMKRFLDLTDEQERAVIPRIEELNSARREFGRTRRLNLMRLRPMIEDQPPDEKAIARLLEQIRADELRMQGLERETGERIRGVLTPSQQARFIFFQERFRQEMQERLQRMRDERRFEPPAGRRRPRR